MMKALTNQSMPIDGRPTIHDVAAAAGVSIATVSRAINEPLRVSPTTRERIVAAIGTLGYAVNAAGRHLAGGATGNVGVLMFLPPGSTQSDVFFMELLRGIELSLQDTSLAVLVSILPCDRAQEPRTRPLPFDRVDGLIVAGEPVPAGYRRAIRRAGLPLVLCWHSEEEPGVWSVAADSRRAAEEVVGHLLGAGRRRVAHIGGPSDVPTAVAKRAGYCLAHERAGVSIDPGLYDVDLALHVRERGVAAVERLLAAGIQFDAIFADDDLIALGAMHALGRAGRRIPDDIAVAGYGDLEEARFAEPPLTTVRVDLHQVGWLGGSLLTKLLAGQVPPPAQISVAPRLVVRASTLPDSSLPPHGKTQGEGDRAD
ncbi:MAG: LacI family DNA-binding transcriptional regulator [Chloroflexi bacterium]|nr:LacI family DNA-binding transcriptional regulator [Chloroflexota bacterium]